MMSGKANKGIKVKLKGVYKADPLEVECTKWEYVFQVY